MQTDISCVLVGNVLGAPIRRDNVMIGFMYVEPYNKGAPVKWTKAFSILSEQHRTLLGGVQYPSHAHAAGECYHVVGGAAQLTRNGETLLCRAGDTVTHQALLQWRPGDSDRPTQHRPRDSDRPTQDRPGWLPLQ